MSKMPPDKAPIIGPKNIPIKIIGRNSRVILVTKKGTNIDKYLKERVNDHNKATIQITLVEDRFFKNLNNCFIDFYIESTEEFFEFLDNFSSNISAINFSFFWGFK